VQQGFYFSFEPRRQSTRNTRNTPPNRTTRIKKCIGCNSPSSISASRDAIFSPLPTSTQVKFSHYPQARQARTNARRNSISCSVRCRTKMSNIAQSHSEPNSSVGACRTQISVLKSSASSMVCPPPDVRNAAAR